MWASGHACMGVACECAGVRACVSVRMGVCVRACGGRACRRACIYEWMQGRGRAGVRAGVHAGVCACVCERVCASVRVRACEHACMVWACEHVGVWVCADVWASVGVQACTSGFERVWVGEPLSETKRNEK